MGQPCALCWPFLMLTILPCWVFFVNLGAAGNGWVSEIWIRDIMKEQVISWRPTLYKFFACFLVSVFRVLHNKGDIFIFILFFMISKFILICFFLNLFSSIWVSWGVDEHIWQEYADGRRKLHLNNENYINM